jgi:hypothetical protein
MASIFLRRKCYWVKYRVNGKSYRETLQTRNKKIAKTKLKEFLRRELAQEIPAEPQKIELQPFLERYFIRLRSRRKKKSAESDINRLKIFFEAVHVRYLQQLPGGICLVNWE